MHCPRPLTAQLLPRSKKALPIRLTALLVLALAGCAEPETAPTPLVRAVKVEAARPANADGQLWIGTVRPRQRADLGVETAGRVLRVAVDIGDRVRSGQVLLQLDPAPAQLRLAQAQAQVDAAAAALADRREQLSQQQGLEADGIVAPAALSAAQAAYDGAHSQWQAARSSAAIMARELALHTIVAPFDGRVTGRSVQAHADVAAGQVLLEMAGAAGLEVVASLPAAQAAAMKPGDVVRVIAPGDPQTGSLIAAPATAAGATVQAVLERLSSRVDNGALVQAVFRISGNAPGLLNGTAVSLEMPGDTTGAAVTVAATALLMGQQPRQAELFVFDRAAGTVTRRSVRVGASLQQARVQVETGLSVGELVVVAGAPFLSDGQRVTEFVPATLLGQRQSRH